MLNRSASLAMPTSGPKALPGKLDIKKTLTSYSLFLAVKLSSGVGRTTDKGGVLMYWNNQWNTICSDDFNDTSARVVCRELGFEDGQAQCCSAYGDLLQYGHIVTHKVMSGNKIT